MTALAITLVTFGRGTVVVWREGVADFAGGCRNRWAGCLLRGLATGLGSQLFMLLTYPLGFFSERTRCLATAQGGPVVVCLHGLYHSPAAFLLIRPALRRAGFSRLFCPAYHSLGTDFDTEARRLASMIRRDLPAGPLLLLGHSLGGLLARRLLAEPDLARRVLAVVTLGTPHGGSRLADWAVGRLGRALIPETELIARMAALADPPGVARLALVSPCDNMVMPLSCLVPRQPGWRIEATLPVSHVAMLYHGPTIARAVAFLRHANAGSAAMRSDLGEPVTEEGLLPGASPR